MKFLSQLLAHLLYLRLYYNHWIYVSDMYWSSNSYLLCGLTAALLKFDRSSSFTLYCWLWGFDGIVNHHFYTYIRAKKCFRLNIHHVCHLAGKSTLWPWQMLNRNFNNYFVITLTDSKFCCQFVKYFPLQMFTRDMTFWHLMINHLKNLKG